MEHKNNEMTESEVDGEKTDKQDFVVVHEKKIKLAVSTSRILDFHLIRKKFTSALKHTEPVFFFYHPEESVKPIFSTSIYKKKFEPTVAALYKGFIGNKLYDSLTYAQLDLDTKRVSTAPKQALTAEKSELELERKLKVVRRTRKNNKNDKANIQRAKTANATYVNEAILRKTSGKKSAETSSTVQVVETLPETTPMTRKEMTVSQSADRRVLMLGGKSSAEIQASSETSTVQAVETLPETTPMTRKEMTVSQSADRRVLMLGGKSSAEIQASSETSTVQAVETLPETTPMTRKEMTVSQSADRRVLMLGGKSSDEIQASSETSTVQAVETLPETTPMTRKEMTVSQSVDRRVLMLGGKSSAEIQASSETSTVQAVETLPETTPMTRKEMTVSQSADRRVLMLGGKSSAEIQASSETSTVQAVETLPETTPMTRKEMTVSQSADRRVLMLGGKSSDEIQASSETSTVQAVETLPETTPMTRKEMTVSQSADHRKEVKTRKSKTDEPHDSDSDTASSSDDDHTDRTLRKQNQKLRQRLIRKSNAIQLLNRRIDKLHRNNDSLNKLNVTWQQQWQRKNETCRCSVAVKVDDAEDCNEPYQFTAEQKLLLARFVLPEDINKYIGEMAKFLFSEDELRTITAAKLDAMKITFMANYIQKNTSVIKTETNIKECLNKKRINLKRTPTGTPDAKQKPKRSKLKRSDDDEPDLSSFLVMNLDAGTTQKSLFEDNEEAEDDVSVHGTLDTELSSD